MADRYGYSRPPARNWSEIFDNLPGQVQVIIRDSADCLKDGVKKEFPNTIFSEGAAKEAVTAVAVYLVEFDLREEKS